MVDDVVKDSPLAISPAELLCSPPLDRIITNTLTLRNTVLTPVSYKVKTTAPKRYIVRPNTGIIQPDQSVDIQVTLTAQKDTPTNLRARDKFLVQALVLSEEQAANRDIKELWTTAKENEIFEYRLKAYFSRPTPPGSPQNIHPTFTPTIPSSKNIPIEDNNTIQEDQETREEDDEKVIHDTQESEQIPQDILQLRVDNNQLNKTIAIISQERDDLKNQLTTLKVKMATLEKESTLRQRKVVENFSRDGQTISTSNKVQKEHLLANRWVQLFLIAIMFFYLGKIL